MALGMQQLRSNPVMIRLTRLNHVPLVINSDLIEHIEITPDTVIALTTGQKFLVLETPDEVIDRVVRFRRSLQTGATHANPHATGAGIRTVRPANGGDTTSG